MLVLEWKERAFIEKVNSRCFCWFPAAILVHQNGAPIWRLHTKLYKGAWTVSANNSETMGHKELRLGQIVYILVFHNISFSWLLPLDGFQFNFFVAWQWKRSIHLNFPYVEEEFSIINEWDESTKRYDHAWFFCIHNSLWTTLNNTSYG